MQEKDDFTPEEQGTRDVSGDLFMPHTLWCLGMSRTRNGVLSWVQIDSELVTHEWRVSVKGYDCFIVEKDKSVYFKVIEDFDICTHITLMHQQTTPQQQSL